MSNSKTQTVHPVSLTPLLKACGLHELQTEPKSAIRLALGLLMTELARREGPVLPPGKVAKVDLGRVFPRMAAGWLGDTEGDGL